MAAPREGFDHVLPELLAAVGTAAVLDVIILRLRHPRWEFPSGAILTGLIIAMVLSPFEPWWVSAATSAKSGVLR